LPYTQKTIQPQIYSINNYKLEFLLFLGAAALVTKKFITD
jgi:hypothetical protein